MIILASCTTTVKNEQITAANSRPNESSIHAAIDSLIYKYGASNTLPIEKGVKHAASLWTNADGSNSEFIHFCTKNFIADSKNKSLLLDKLSNYFESLDGHFNKITLDLKQNVDLNNGELLDIDKTFSGYSVSAHLQDDLYANKIAFGVALNFPYCTLKEKESEGKNWSRSQWAAARWGSIRWPPPRWSCWP